MHIMKTRSRDGHVWWGLMESYWDKKKKRSCKRTICTLTGIPEPLIEAMRQELQRNRDGVTAGSAGPAARPRSGPAMQHGGFSAVLGTIQRIGLDKVLWPRRTRRRALAEALLIERVRSPGSKCRVARTLARTPEDPEPAYSLGPLLGVADATPDDLYATMDWLLERQPDVERALARRHLADGELLLYDVSSSYFEGSKCGLGRYGYSRDHRRDRLQIVFGLLCAGDGCPVAVEVFPGNTADSATVPAQLRKLRDRFGLRRITLVGDRGMLTQARILQDLKRAQDAVRAEVDWITALRAPTLRRLVRQQRTTAADYEPYALAEVESTLFPGERLLIAHNPALGAKRRRDREAMLAATEAGIRAAAERHAAGRIDREALSEAVGALRPKRMLKHFRRGFDEATGAYRWARDAGSIATEAALDGLFVLRTSLPADRMAAADVMRAYQSLADVETLFRTMKTGHQVHPIRHYRDPRVRSHVFLCMLAGYVEWHMRQALRPLLFDDPDPPDPAPPAARRGRSAAARRRDSQGVDGNGYPLTPLQELLNRLQSIVVHDLIIPTPDGGECRIPTMSTLRAHERRVFQLLGCQPHPPPPTVRPAPKAARRRSRARNQS